MTIDDDSVTITSELVNGCVVLNTSNQGGSIKNALWLEEAEVQGLVRMLQASLRQLKKDAG